MVVTVIVDVEVFSGPQHNKIHQSRSRFFDWLVSQISVLKNRQGRHSTSTYVTQLQPAQEPGSVELEVVVVPVVVASTVTELDPVVAAWASEQSPHKLLASSPSCFSQFGPSSVVLCRGDPAVS